MSNIDVRITGRPTAFALKIGADSVRTALLAITRMHQELEAVLWDENGTVREKVEIGINGALIDPNTEAETALDDGDVLDLRLPGVTNSPAAESDQTTIQTKLEAEVHRLHHENLELRQMLGQSQPTRRASGSGRHPADFLNYAFHNDGAAIVSAMKQELGDVTLVGPRKVTTTIASLIAESGSVSTFDWSPQDEDYPNFEGNGVLCLVPKNIEEWAAVSSYIEKMEGRLTPLWRLIMRYGLFKDLMRVFEYNVTEFDELLRLYSMKDHGSKSTDQNLGRRPMDPINALDDIIPLDGKSVIEFGPSDGNHTAALLSLGAGPVTLVEGRGENVVKLLVAKWVMGWDQLEIHYDNFQLPGPWAKQQYDLIYAHGVYYHCQNPLIFLDLLVDLGNSIFVGGWCATDSKPPDPWTNVSHGEHSYRLKPFPESHHFLSGLDDTSWMMDADEMIAFFERRGFTVDVISRDQATNQLGEVFLRFLARR